MLIVVRVLLRRALIAQAVCFGALMWLLVLAEAAQTADHWDRPGTGLRILRHLADAADAAWLVAAGLAIGWVTLRLRRDGQLLALLRLGARGVLAMRFTLILAACLMAGGGTLLHGLGELVRQRMEARGDRVRPLVAADGWIGIGEQHQAGQLERVLMMQRDGPGLYWIDQTEAADTAGRLSFRPLHSERLVGEISPPLVLTVLRTHKASREWLRPWAWDDLPSTGAALAGLAVMSISMVLGVAGVALLATTSAWAAIGIAGFVILCGGSSVTLLVACWRGSWGFVSVTLLIATTVPMVLAWIWARRGHRRLSG